jgi:DNA invertase Pin-like site-specific DNA recombinase
MSKGQLVGYVRVSSLDQNTARQLDGLDLDRIFEDHASGKDTHRPQLQEMLRFVRDGDTVIVHSMDRLARNVDDLRTLVMDLTSRGVRVDFHREGLTFTGERNPMNTLLLTLLGAVAEFLRAQILENQREGIAKAKQAGKYRGRKPALTTAQVQDVRQRVQAGAQKTALAREFGISRETLYTYLRSG